MAKELTAKFKNRADTAINWTTANPILGLGELGLEKDTNKIKFGDGVSTWNSLPYYSDIPTASSITIADAGNLITATNVEDALQENRQQINDLDAEVVAHKEDGTQHKKTARFVIGTSTAGWTESDCDYLCDGTDDQVEINNAITALPATGGEIVILDGTYNITGAIEVTKNKVHIKGNGNATILKRMYNSTEADSGATARGLITINGRDYCKISDLQIDGNKINFSGGYNHNIYINTSNNNTITGNTCNNTYYGIYINTSNNNTITGNTCNYNSYGIRLYSSSNNIITSNTCIRGTGLPTDYNANQYTINLIGINNNYNLISLNNCMGKAPTIGGGIGNTVINNKWNETSDFEDLRADVGDKSSLTTDNKTNLVSAINEHEGQINDLGADKANKAWGETFEAVLQNGWSGALRYTMNDNKLVNVSGYLTVGTLTTDTVVATLPTEYRPILSKMMLSFRTNPRRAVLALYLSSTGEVRTIPPGNSELTAGQDIYVGATYKAREI